MAQIPPLTLPTPQVPTVSPPGASPGDPRGTALSIGPVTFLDIEHPPELEFGLEQKQAVHELIGGGRVVQSLGPQPKEVSWKGSFFYAGAQSRSKALKLMAASGKTYPVKWGSEAYSSVIKEYLPRIINDWQVDYTITVTVVSDLSGSFSSGSVLSIDTQTQALFQQSQTELTTLTGLDPTAGAIQPNLSSVGTLLGQLGPIAQAVGQNVSQLTSAITTVVGQVQTYVNTVTSTLNLPGQISQTVQQQFSVSNRLLSNLKMIQSNVSSGQAPRRVTVNGGNLFVIASQYYGDPTLATNILAANGLQSMQLSQGQQVTLMLPPATATPLG